MALIWELRDPVSGDHYQVRRAGASLRLYSNGVFHSQYNPQRPLAGSVWDLLALPALARAAGVSRRILVLGVGGGAVIRQLNYLLYPDLVVGVELNPVHLLVARRFFGVNQANVCLLEADARAWVAHYRGPAFDVIIDDLFGHDNGEPVRAITADSHWCQALLNILEPEGTLVMNFDSASALAASAPRRELRSVFPGQWALTTPGYENHIGVFFRESLSHSQRQRNLDEQLSRHPDLSRAHLRYQLTVL